jgi:glycosyltransferase involved in cell wall biosynthesis
LNILVIALRGPSNQRRADGAREILVHLGKRWVEQGHQVRVLCIREGAELPRREIVCGVEVIRAGGFHSALAVLPRLYITQHREWADVVLESIFAYPLYVPLYSRRPTSVVVHHVMGRSWFEVLPFPKALFGYLTERSIGYFYRRTRLVVISEGTRRDVVGLGVPPDRIVVAPCGVDVEQYVPGRESRQPLVCFVGSLSDRRKRVEDVIDAFPYIEEQVPGVRLVIAGDGQREAALRKRAAAYENVEFVGLLVGQGKVDLYQRSWVGVFPSVKEGFLLTAVEASACGTPPVIYEHPGLTTVLDGKTGLVLPEGGPQPLARAVVSLLKDRERRMEMGRKARAHASGFSWDRMAEIVLMALSQEAGKQMDSTRG